MELSFRAALARRLACAILIPPLRAFVAGRPRPRALDLVFLSRLLAVCGRCTCFSIAIIGVLRSRRLEASRLARNADLLLRRRVR